MLTDYRTTQLDALSEQLEEQYHRYTEELTILTERLRGGGDDPETMAMVADCRQVLADTARALRHLAENRYGVCEACHEDIPVPRLEVLPQARFCAQCQRDHPRRSPADQTVD